MSVPVIVYTSTGCPHCVKVKDQLKDWGVVYEERNVSDHQEYFEQLQQRRIFGTPATFIGERFVLGFNPDKMRTHLENHGVPMGTSQTTSAESTEYASPSSPPEKPDASSSEDELFQPLTADLLNEVYDFVAIGGGPAGASAALYTARSKMKTLVIDKAPAAGTLAITHKIANYPGIRQELTGLALLLEMQKHAKDFGAAFVRSQVLSVDFSDPEVKKLHTPEGTVLAKSVFIAVGAKASSKIAGEEEFTGRGVSYCSTCDAAFFEGRSVIVAGDTEEALHEAAALAKFCSKVQLLVPGAVFKGVSEEEIKAVAELPNVELYYKHKIKAIRGEDTMEGVTVIDDQKQESHWTTDGVFLYLSGLKPGTSFLQGAVEVDQEGYVLVDDHLRTNIDGVFAGGDARRTPIKQAVVSAADGCIAALAADQHVNKRGKLRPQYS